jgi:hypothetical protein
MRALPDLGVPAIAGRAIPNEIAAACVRVAVREGAIQTCSGKAQDRHRFVDNLVCSHFGLPAGRVGVGFVDFAIIRDGDCSPRLVLGEYAWDHRLTPEDAAKFEACAIAHAGRVAVN